MSSVGRRRFEAWIPLVLCTLVLPFGALLIRPWVELGVVDDWSYIRTSQVLANSGHITYNGWATAMLGWQLYVGALIIKLFGFSFTAPRVGTLLVATGAGALMQRLYVRLGLSEWNSAAVTLIFLCSPPFLATTFSFMSDAYGMLVLLGCCYCSVRALQAERASAATAWVCAAAIGTGVGGTTRQIAWVGVLVMVPCTIWLLRRNRSAVLLGSLCTVLAVGMIPFFLWWFNRQPYSIPESAFPAQAPSLAHLVTVDLPNFIERAGFEVLFLTTPLLLCFLRTVGRSRRALLALSLVLSYWCIRIPHLHRGGDLWTWGVPYIANNFWFSGWEEFPSYVGKPALLLTPHVRLVLTVLVLAGELGLINLLLLRRPAAADSLPVAVAPVRVMPRLSPTQLLLLLGPCTLAYLILLLPRFLYPGLLDRYLMFPAAILLGVAVLLYQAKVSSRLPGAVWIFAACYMAVNVMGMHDTFDLFRAQAKLLARLQGAGVPRVQVDGGAQFNGWTEILQSGHLNDPRIRIPAGVYRPMPLIHSTDRCHTRYLELTPSVHAKYVVSFDPNACGGRTGYEEAFSSWLGPNRQVLYAVRGPE